MLRGQAEGGAEGGDWTDEAHSQVRRITAQRMLESKTTVPHYYLTVDCRMDKLLALRAQLNRALEKDGGKISVNDLIVKASAMARPPPAALSRGFSAPRQQAQCE